MPQEGRRLRSQSSHLFGALLFDTAAGLQSRFCVSSIELVAPWQHVGVSVLSNSTCSLFVAVPTITSRDYFTTLTTKYTTLVYTINP